MKLSLKLIIALGVLFILAGFFIFTVDETEQAVILQFGKPVAQIKEPGLHVKLPAPVQTVTFFDDRLLEYDAAPTEVIMQDKKTLVVDNYSRWRIADSLLFLQTVRDENGAQTRLDDIIYSELRVELGRYNLQEIVSSTRDSIMNTVTVRCAEKAREYGIEVADVRIKRADLPEENERAVFDRMKSERLRMATLHRSGGEEQSRQIRAQTLRDSTIIIADAYKIAQKNRGEGDSAAVKIYAGAFGKDVRFFEFTRTMDAYTKTLSDKTVIVIGTNNEFLNYLKRLQK